ncbi:MAG TPA: SOS response-associated peptidase family protein [Candidatus Didemnitutus sp.]|jgi:putative SOS response-associated peptidase YedK
MYIGELLGSIFTEHSGTVEIVSIAVGVCFYEWKRDGERKQPFDIHLTGRRSFCMAGIFADSSDLHSATYLMFTKGANEMMKNIHDRMPLNVGSGRGAEWISPEPISNEAFAEFVRPHSAAEMEAVPVLRIVNNARFDRPECLAPID